MLLRLKLSYWVSRKLAKAQRKKALREFFLFNKADKTQSKLLL